MKFYKCSICGKIVAMVEERNVPTICCGKPMDELVPNTQDGAVEKHVPVVTVKDNIAHVAVGAVTHPSLPEHYIQWIAIRTNKGNQRKMLKPGDAPEADFALLPDEVVLEALEYCNLHGLYSK